MRIKVGDITRENRVGLTKNLHWFLVETVRLITGCPYQTFTKANLWRPEGGLMRQITKDCPHNLSNRHVVRVTLKKVFCGLPPTSILFPACFLCRPASIPCLWREGDRLRHWAGQCCGWEVWLHLWAEEGVSVGQKKSTNQSTGRNSCKCKNIVHHIHNLAKINLKYIVYHKTISSRLWMGLLWWA